MHSGLYTLLALLCCAGYVPRINAEDKEVEYKLVVDKFTKDIEHADVMTWDLSFDNQDNEVIISGQVQQFVDLNDDWKVGFEFLRANDDGEYSVLFAMTDREVCGIMSSVYKSYFYESLKNYANAPDPDECPVKKETYDIKGYKWDFSRYKKYMKPGLCRIVGTLSFENEVKGRYILDMHVE